MRKLLNLNGKKTYLISLGVILTGVGGYLSGQQDLITSLLVILNGLGLGSARHAISKI